MTVNAPAKTRFKIDSSTKNKLLNKLKEESQFVIHCTYTGSIWEDKIRIWKSTFLYAHDSTHKSELIHSEGITLYPVWMPVDPGTTVKFTLIFTGLPKDCKHFDLVEKIPAPGGFIKQDIGRNNADIYSVDRTF